MFDRMRLLFELTKLKISGLATLSALAGFVLARGDLSAKAIPPLLGTFLLAAGACCLNQIQDRQIDGLMERTRHRPLPSGRLSPRSALRFSACLIASGIIALLGSDSRAALGLGLFAVLWYNGVYTYLKRWTAFAVVPGALIGVIPPLLGWASAGGSLSGYRVWGIAFFLFIWQVPHFWLLLLKYARDYEQAGLPTLTATFSSSQIRRILFAWLLSTAASCLLVPLLQPMHRGLTFFLLLGISGWMIRKAFAFVRPRCPGDPPAFSFTGLNLYAFVVLIVLSVDSM